ncbi:g3607 [Coccomyxa viridis]|uniref:Non-structural maintenance of chromosomes element 4 n=1 Tax=Coccomyxa viridis TaxID=1274662 RepID=A0ABP1FN71_9CHLO
MASTDTGPSNIQAARKPTAAEKKERRAEKLAKHREKVEESIKVLGEYAELRKKIQGDTVNLKEGDGFLTVLEQVNGLHTRVTIPKEQLKDGEVFHMLSEKAVEIVQEKVGGEKHRNPLDLIRGLRAQYVASGDAQEDGASIAEAFNWMAFARDIAQYFKHAPGLSCMLGPMDAAPKVRKQIVRQKKQPLEKLVAAKEVDAVPEEQEEVIRNMYEMMGALDSKESKAANVLQCIINHRSFSQTIENLFALSFLVRDGRVTVTRAENGQGYTVTALGKADMHERKKGKERSQCILSLDMRDWEDYCTRVHPGSCLMSHRPPAYIAGAPRTPHTGERGPESSRARKQKRKAVTEPSTEEELEPTEVEEEEAKAAALARMKGKKKARIQD